ISPFSTRKVPGASLARQPSRVAPSKIEIQPSSWEFADAPEQPTVSTTAAPRAVHRFMRGSPVRTGEGEGGRSAPGGLSGVLFRLATGCRGLGGGEVSGCQTEKIRDLARHVVFVLGDLAVRK